MNTGTRKSRRELNRRLKFHLMLVGALSSLAIGSTATISYFSDTAEAEVTVTAGTINLGIGQPEQKSFSLDLGTGWHPGVSATREVEIHNSGNLPISYTMRTNNFGIWGPDEMTLEIFSNGSRIFSGQISYVWLLDRTLNENTSETLTFKMTWEDHGQGFYAEDKIFYSTEYLFTAKVK